MIGRAAAGTGTLYVGVDEAGYGPLLGPLCLAAAAFRCEVPEAPEDPFEVDLRARLRGLVRRTPTGRRRPARPLPVPVDDSKRIKQRLGLVGLAQGVGAFAAALGAPPPADLRDLLRRFSDDRPEDLGPVPWFRRPETARVPRYPRFGALHERFAARGVTARDLRVRAVPARALNGAFRETGNKARVLGTLSISLVLSILERHRGGDAIVTMDRQGGRTHYGGYLAEHLPLSRVRRVEAPPGESRYVVTLPERLLRFRFVTAGDRRCLAVGWASMAAKLTRELCMTCLNGWFQARRPDLRPTAGYVTDGRRFLQDVAPVIDAERLAPELLVRSR